MGLRCWTNVSLNWILRYKRNENNFSHYTSPIFFFSMDITPIFQRYSRLRIGITWPNWPSLCTTIQNFILLYGLLKTVWYSQHLKTYPTMSNKNCFRHRLENIYVTFVTLYWYTWCEQNLAFTQIETKVLFQWLGNDFQPILKEQAFELQGQVCKHPLHPQKPSVIKEISENWLGTCLRFKLLNNEILQNHIIILQKRMLRNFIVQGDIKSIHSFVYTLERNESQRIR